MIPRARHRLLILDFSSFFFRLILVSGRRQGWWVDILKTGGGQGAWQLGDLLLIVGLLLCTCINHPMLTESPGQIDGPLMA
jgi:hypothetical protein